MNEELEPRSPAERARRRRVLTLTLLLLIGLPLYLIVAAFIVAAVNPAVELEDGTLARRFHWAVELVIYLGLGLVWAFPLKTLVKGVGRAAPDA